MVTVYMTQEAGQGCSVPWLMPEVIDANLGELGYDAFEGRHGGGECHGRLSMPSCCRAALAQAGHGAATRLSGGCGSRMR